VVVGTRLFRQQAKYCNVKGRIKLQAPRATNDAFGYEPLNCDAKS
jgi:hypothetical protein